jgi:disulfide bond formation protein DsbB
MTMAYVARRTRDAPWLLAMAIVCFAAVAGALYAQQVYDMRPCPWCILQRVIYLLIGLVCLGAVALRGVRKPLVAVVLLLAGLGVASAVYQHVVAAKQFSCDLTLADRILTALRVESLLPPLFQVTASCAEAAATVFGVPFEYWSLALFAMIAAVSLRLLVRVTRRW